MCLQAGKNWEEGFCDGLVKSAYFVCLLSRRAINHSDKVWQNFSKLEISSKCDNVLLEWRLALELLDRGMIEGIYPVFIGDSDGTGLYSNYFNDGCQCGPMIESSVDAVESKLMEHLDRQALGMPYRWGVRAGVQTTAVEVMANQGGFVQGDAVMAVNEMAIKILAMIKSDVNVVSNGTIRSI